MPAGGNFITNQLGNPADPDFIELLIRGHAVEADGTNQAFINQLHLVKVGSVGVPTNLTSVYNAFFAIFNGPINAALSSTYVADNVTLRAMDSPINMPVSFINPITGAIGGDRLPSFNAVVTRKYTYGRGRSYRGSNHWGPIAESDTTLDQLNAGAQTRWDAVAAALQAYINQVDADGNAWSLFVLSPTLSDLTANPSVFTGSILRLSSANAIIGTMKRRKQGVGV